MTNDYVASFATEFGNKAAEKMIDIMRAVAREVAAEQNRPAVIASESGTPSVKLNTTAAGATQFEVKVYHQDVHEAKRLATEIYEELLIKWGAPSSVSARR